MNITIEKRSNLFKTNQPNVCPKKKVLNLNEKTESRISRGVANKRDYLFRALIFISTTNKMFHNDRILFTLPTCFHQVQKTRNSLV